MTLQINSIKTLEFTETNSYFYSCTYEKKKTYLAVVSLLPAVGKFFMNLLTDRKAVGSTQKYFLLAGDINLASIFISLQLHQTNEK